MGQFTLTPLNISGRLKTKSYEEMDTKEPQK